jgi:hypothetical protein
MTSEPKDERAAIGEEKLILRLLAGFDENKSGAAATFYPERDSDAERESRAALARQIRAGNLAGMSRELLALAIDPDTPSVIPGTHAIRRLKFEDGQGGAKDTWARDRIIVQFIRRAMRGSNDQAPSKKIVARRRDHNPSRHAGRTTKRHRRGQGEGR